MTINADGLYLLNKADAVASRVQLGTSLGSVKATFNATGGKAIGTHGLDVTLPVGAIVRRAYYVVRTTFTSATDAATIALRVNSANDLVTANDIADVSNPWDAGAPVATAAIDTPATFITLTANRELSAVVAVEALTAGKLDLFVEYDI